MKADLKSLQVAHRKVAALVLIDPVYLPIFERIEREIDMLNAESDVISRARAIAAHQWAVA